MPRSAIIWTRSRELSLKVRYHLTHRTIISWSKCRPLKSSCAEAGSVIQAVTAGSRAFQVCTRTSETTLKQDEGKKLLAYQDAGIPEYWIVDVAAKVVRIHRLNQAKTYSEETHSKDTIALQAFPDVTIDLGNLF